MPSQSRRESTHQRKKLAAAIAAFQVGPTLASIGRDAYGEEVLARLMMHDGVAGAFATIPRAWWERVLHDAIIGERVARGLAEEAGTRKGGVKGATKAADAALQSLETVRKFLAADMAWVKADVDCLEHAIARRKRLNEAYHRTKPRTRDPASARARGIGWIKEAVKDACGRPNVDAVGRIAEAALDTGDVSEEAVRKAPTPSSVLARLPVPVEAKKALSGTSRP